MRPLDAAPHNSMHHIAFLVKPTNSHLSCCLFVCMVTAAIQLTSVDHHPCILFATIRCVNQNYMPNKHFTCNERSQHRDLFRQPRQQHQIPINAKSCNSHCNHIALFANTLLLLVACLRWLLLSTVTLAEC